MKRGRREPWGLIMEGCYIFIARVRRFSAAKCGGALVWAPASIVAAVCGATSTGINARTNVEVDRRWAGIFLLIVDAATVFDKSHTSS